MQIECALKYEAIYDCYTQKEEANLREKFLLDQMEQAVNETQLGRVFKFTNKNSRYFSVELKFQHTKNEKISLVYMFSDNLFLHWSPDFVVKICSSILQDCIFQICTSKCLTWKVKEKWSVNNYFLDSFFYILKKKFKKETHTFSNFSCMFLNPNIFFL